MANRVNPELSKDRDSLPITKVLQRLADVLDRRLFKTPSFLFSILSNSLSQMGFFVPYAFLPNSAISYGINDNVIAWFISVIGIASVFGRPLSGWMACKFYRQKILIYIIVLIFCAFSITVMQISKQMIFLILACALYGACSGAAITLSYSILPDIVLASSLNNSLGVTLLFQGLGAVIGTPIAGFIASAYKNDSMIYTYGGITYLSGALLLFPIIYLMKTKKIKENFHQDSLFSVNLKFPEIAYNVERRNSATNSYYIVADF